MTLLSGHSAARWGALAGWMWPVGHQSSEVEINTEGLIKSEH